jgi:hypothetical protein
MTRTTLALILLPIDCAVASLCFRLLPAAHALTAAVALALSTSTVLLLAPSRLEFKRNSH